MDSFFESPKHTIQDSANGHSTIQNDTSMNDSTINKNNTSLVTVLSIDTLNISQSDLQNSMNNSLKDSNSAPDSPQSLQLNLSTTFTLNNVSTHTFRKTEWDVKKLENYVRNAFCDHTPMESMRPVLLNRYLKSFFELAKKSDGMDYEPESLIGFMNSFERYLKTKQYPESLLRSETFKEARLVLKKKRDLVRSIGKLIRTKTKDTCYLLQFHRNLLKEKGLLSRDNPDCLLAEIYLNNMIYFGEYLKEDKAWRGNLNLVWGDMLLERDPQNGLEYLTLATYAKKSSRNQQFQTGVVKISSRTKTGTQLSKLKSAAAAATANSITNGLPLGASIDSSQTPRVYAQRQPANWCPVEAYKIYRARRPNNCLDRDSPFYLAPLFKSKNQSKVWYKALAMSCQRLDALFYCLFKKAGVDLTSLANMSSSQQTTNSSAAVLNGGSNANGSAIGILTNSSNWNSLIKQNASDNEDDDSIMNGQHATGAGVSTTLTANPAYSTLANHYQQHHTIVPAQIQVQVQIQVPISTNVTSVTTQIGANQQQSIDTSVNNNTNNNGTTNQSRLYLLSPTSSNQNTGSIANASYTILEA